MKTLPLFQVDAFADEPFTGNPAAVCLLEDMLSDEELQNIAMEMNLSETAFVLPIDDGFRLRWCTPKKEVDLCGHATLAASHVIWTNGIVPTKDPIEFQTRSGKLVATMTNGEIELNFPSQPSSPCVPPEGLLEALGVEPRYVGRNAADYLVQVSRHEEILALQPDFQKLRTVECRGVIVTSESHDGDFDFISRFFAPAFGIDEDPVTGSAHCCLTPFWSENLGRLSLAAYQASQRGGKLNVRLENDRVVLCGKAITVLEGKLKF